MRRNGGAGGTGVDALRSMWRRRRGRIVDVLLLVLVLGAGVAASESAAGSGAFGIWRFSLTAVVAASLWWRRAYPVSVAVLAIVAVASGASEFALQASLFSLAIRRRDRLLTWLTLAGAAAFMITWVTTVQPGQGLAGVVGGVFAAAFFVGLPVGFGAYVGARRDLLASLWERAERAEAEQQLRAEQALLSERSRIAQEMHDVLAHRISLVALHAGGLEVNPDAGPEQVERAALLIRTTARQALEDLRGVLGVLRADGTEDGAPLAPQPTLDDVPRLVEGSRQAGVSVSVDNRLATEAVPPDVVGRTAYRVVQEGLTNVHKHARGAAATVTLSGAPGRGLSVAVRDVRPVGWGHSSAGRRYPHPLAGNDLPPLVPGAGMGLVGLTERVELAGGRLTAGRVDGGFSVDAWLPWPA